MNKIKEYIKVAAILIYGYCSAWITPYEIRCAIGIRKGIQCDPEGEMFILPSIFLLIIFAVIDFVIIMLVTKSSNKTKNNYYFSFCIINYCCIYYSTKRHIKSYKRYNSPFKSLKKRSVLTERFCYFKNLSTLGIRPILFGVYAGS